MHDSELVDYLWDRTLETKGINATANTVDIYFVGMFSAEVGYP